VLLALVSEGKIKKNKDSEKMGPEFGWWIEDEEIARQKSAEKGRCGRRSRRGRGRGART
jgi:hypothetical protein